MVAPSLTRIFKNRSQILCNPKVAASLKTIVKDDYGSRWLYSSEFRNLRSISEARARNCLSRTWKFYFTETRKWLVKQGVYVQYNKNAPPFGRPWAAPARLIAPISTKPGLEAFFRSMVLLPNSRNCLFFPILCGPLLRGVPGWFKMLPGIKN